ncbi:extracellular solute-binding protein [Paenibacillus albicereus]|uniref:Extracellular solute-binding protein n=1 Tax=Paenibacillus albicereus TaxID=2726185 RepID=A0A6H2GWG9_9BACL|nr:extracellular solute-binding protein [Paenibacillus albicereus]QJC51516.1 extracellular solute-binding protein [Paenibacillus albicereus]
MKTKQAAAAAFLCALVLASACSNGNGNGGNAPAPGTNAAAGNGGAAEAAPDGPMSPYAETVSYTTVKGTTQNPNFPNGDTYEKNIWQDYVEKKLNVKGKISWSAPTDGEQYSKKLSVDIASNQLPDIFMIDGSTATPMLKQLVEGDMIEDLSEVFDKYASDTVKEHYAVDDNTALNGAKFDGKLMAIPGVPEQAQPMLVWLRQDWLEKLKLPEPKTLDDVRTISKAFTTQDPDGNGKNDTLGLVAQSNPDFYSNSFNLHTLDTVFWTSKAFPKTWIKGDDGTVKWGGIQPEVKTALGIIRDMYKEGSLDSDFGLKDGGKTTEDVSSGKAGMVFEAWYAPFYPLGNTLRNNPNAEWKPYAILDSEGKLQVASNPTPVSYIVVRKGYENPELAMKLINLSTEILERKDPEIQALYEQYKEIKLSTLLHPTYIDFGIADPEVLGKRYIKYKDLVEGKADESILGPDDTDGWVSLKQEMETPFASVRDKLSSMSDEDKNAAFNNHISWVAWMDALKLSSTDNLNYVTNVFNGSTKTMDRKWESLLTMQKQAYLKIITGNEPLDSFDRFVEDWNKQGGDQVTQEVQEEVQKNNG